MNCSYVSASSNLLKNPRIQGAKASAVSSAERIQVILRFFSVIAEAFLTASHPLGDHRKTIFLLKSIILLDPGILVPWHPGRIFRQ
jgi:hypothetical protein